MRGVAMSAVVSRPQRSHFIEQHRVDHGDAAPPGSTRSSSSTRTARGQHRRHELFLRNLSSRASEREPPLPTQHRPSQGRGRCRLRSPATGHHTAVLSCLGAHSTAARLSPKTAAANTRHWCRGQGDLVEVRSVAHFVRRMPPVTPLLESRPQTPESSIRKSVPRAHQRQACTRRQRALSPLRRSAHHSLRHPALHGAG